VDCQGRITPLPRNDINWWLLIAGFMVIMSLLSSELTEAYPKVLNCAKVLNHGCREHFHNPSTFGIERARFNDEIGANRSPISDAWRPQRAQRFGELTLDRLIRFPSEGRLRQQII
jgi:hypothetical protein